MRRTGRIAGEILTALSLLLCLAVVALWVRSYRVRDLIAYGPAGGNNHIAQSILGRLHVLSDRDGGSTGGASYRADRLSPQAIWNGGMSDYPLDVRWRLGVVWQTYTRTHIGFGQPWTSSHRLIVVPYWLLAGVFALPPLARVLRRYRTTY
jgi:hypothetical protein